MTYVVFDYKYTREYYYSSQIKIKNKILYSKLKQYKMPSVFIIEKPVISSLFFRYSSDIIEVLQKFKPDAKWEAEKKHWIINSTRLEELNTILSKQGITTCIDRDDKVNQSSFVKKQNIWYEPKEFDEYRIHTHNEGIYLFDKLPYDIYKQFVTKSINIDAKWVNGQRLWSILPEFTSSFHEICSSNGLKYREIELH